MVECGSAFNVDPFMCKIAFAIDTSSRDNAFIYGDRCLLDGLNLDAVSGSNLWVSTENCQKRRFCQGKLPNLFLVCSNYH